MLMRDIKFAVCHSVRACLSLSSRSEKTAVKELLKLVYSCQSWCKNKSGTLF